VYFCKGGFKLIEVIYDDSKNAVVLTPENMDENYALMERIKMIPGVFYVGGQWFVPKEHINVLNQNVASLKRMFKIHDSFKDFVKENNLQSSNEIIRIRCGVINSKILGKNVPHKDIEDVCKFFWKPAVRNERFKSKKWDGFIHLYKRWERTFPTGLLHLVEEVLKKKGFKYEITYLYEQRPQRQFDWYVDDGLTPDPDQVEAVEAGYNGLRGILKCPTGKPLPFSREIC